MIGENEDEDDLLIDEVIQNGKNTGKEYELFVKSIYERLNAVDGLKDVSIQHNVILTDSHVGVRPHEAVGEPCDISLFYLPDRLIINVRQIG